MRHTALRGLLVGLALLGLVSCDATWQTPGLSGVTPQARPAEPEANAPRPSARSRALATYYGRFQADLLVQGLLRRDGGGPDTPFTDTALIRNFETIALRDEYVRGEGFRRSNGEFSRIKRWHKPVRVVAEFGESVAADQRARDVALLSNYVSRLDRITGHPIAMASERDANFHVLFIGQDDQAQIKPRIQELVPNVNPTALQIFDSLPRAIHCLVIAFSEEPGGYTYGTAIALVRAEHPDLLRQSCIHEEVAQGLGLANDSPRARPSIFNDDDEFALLTTHDELLLKILYNPRIRAGMSAAEARPIVTDVARGLLGVGS